MSLIIAEQKKDPFLSEIINYCLTGWPAKVPLSLKIFHSVANEFSVVNDVLCRAGRIVIPASLREDTLNCIHEGHQGIVKSLERARTTVWWPNITKHVKDKIASCEVCCRFLVNRAEPLIPTDLPSRPWEKIAMDIFFYENKNYLLVIDYFSRWIEVPLLTSITSANVIIQLKSIFARMGIPEEIYSDNGSQFIPLEFSEFAKKYNFKHTTSSPNFPSSNGMSERGVQTIKSLLKKCKISKQDPYLALLSYRSTPLKNGYSPADLLMGRKLKTTLPIMPHQLCPEPVDIQKVKNFEQNYRENYKQYSDCKSGARNAKPTIATKDRVLLKEGEEGVVWRHHSAPRSHISKKDDGGFVRRNRRHFVCLPSNRETSPQATPQPLPPSPPSSPMHPSESSEQNRRINLRKSVRSNKGKLPNRFDNFDMSRN